MTLHAPARPRPGRPAGHARTTSAPRQDVPAAAAPAGGDDRALDEALAHISDLAERLWAVRRTHPQVRVRTLLRGTRLQCGGCGHASPCPTLRAADPS